MIYTSQGFTVSHEPSSSEVWIATSKNGGCVVIGKGRLREVIKVLSEIASEQFGTMLHSPLTEAEKRIEESGASLGYTDERQDSLPFNLEEPPNAGHG